MVSPAGNPRFMTDVALRRPALSMPSFIATPRRPVTSATIVVIAEPNRIYAESLSRICTEIFHTAHPMICQRADEALAIMRRQPTDLLLQGLMFDDMNGVDLLQKVSTERLARHILVISERWNQHMFVALRSARFNGAVDTVSESIETVQHALQEVLSGGFYISKTLRPYLIDDLPNESQARKLTEAEIRVLQVIGNGSDNQEAAEILGLSVATVQTHRRNIMRKLRVHTSAKLVHEAVRLGIVRIFPTTSSEHLFRH